MQSKLVRLFVLSVAVLFSQHAIAQAPVDPKVDPPKPTLNVVLDGPTTVASGGFVVRFDLTTDAIPTWNNKYPTGATPPFVAKDENDKKMLVFVNSVQGEYRFSLMGQLSVDKKDGADPIILRELVTTVGPPPEPKPTPTPPGPTPPGPNPPGPAPIAVDGLRLLITYDKPSTFKPEMRWFSLIENSTVLRAYLNANCVKVDGVPEFRIWPETETAEAESKIWQDAMKLPRTASPNLIVSNGKQGVSIACPKTVEEIIAICDQYKVQK